MTATEEQRRVKALLEETIVLLCKNGLDFKSEFTVEALIGITLDKKDVILISIKETIQNDPLRANEDNMANDGSSLHSNSSMNNGSSLEDEEFNYNVEYKTPTNSGSLSNPSHEFDHSHKVASQLSAKLDRELDMEGSGHNNQISYSLNSGNNENSQPFSNLHERQISTNRHKRTFQKTFESRSCNIDNQHKSNSAKASKNKLQEVTVETPNEVSPLTSHNTATENTPRSFPLNIQICKSEPPDFEDLSSVMRDTFGHANNSNNTPGSLTMKWHTDELLADLSNMVHSAGLGRPPMPGGKEGCIEGISSLLNLPLQHPTPQNMSMSNAAMNLASTSFLDPSNVRPGYSQGQASVSKTRYKCNICFKEVRLLRDLRAHMATKHNLEKDFSCSVCGTGFTYKHNLFVHLRTVHRLNDRPTATALT